MTTTAQSGIRMMTADDLYNLKMASDAQISPDGSLVVFVKTWLNKEKNDYRSSLYLVSTDGGDEHRLTSADCQDSFPRWSPDGSSIAFISTRSEKPQVFLLSMRGGEAAQLTTLDEGVSAFAWSPDGSTLAVVSKSESEKSEKGEDESKSDVVHITSIRYKANGVPGFLDEKRNHIWCVSVPTGDARQVTSGDFDDASPSWLPGGNEIAFASDRSDHREYGRDKQIWVVNARGGEPRRIAGDENDTFSNPSVAPDGTTVAFTGHRDAQAGGSRVTRIWTTPVSGEGLNCLTEGLDRSTSDSTAADFSGKSNPGLVWIEDGNALLTQVSDQGNVHVYRVSTSGEVDLVIGGERRILDFSVSGSKITYAVSDPLNPADLFVCDLDGSNERKLTSLNSEFLDGVTLSEPESFRVPSHNDDGWDVHGWIMRPPNAAADAKYPMVLQIHGGPHGMYGNSFFHEFQTLAAAGYVVVYSNPRGSEGYGEEFCSCTRARWGEADMPDVMAIVDYAIENAPVDPNRLGVTGGSYGGYLTNWIIGHTDRFAAAITDRCVSDFYSMYGTSDIGYSFLEYEAGGTPWDSRELYIKYSPITYVEQMHTPLLIVHSEQDYRCPIEQAEQLFISLKRLGRTVEFVRFPNENHELSRSGQPKHRIQRIEFNLDWWSRYL
jgi:dipeptidyl aminopeptidase/acylaminoacyl peptidase